MVKTEIVVDGAWMRACGYKPEPIVMTVTRERGRLPCGDMVYDVELDDGRPWTVIEFRLVASAWRAK